MLFLLKNKQIWKKKVYRKILEKFLTEMNLYKKQSSYLEKTETKKEDLEYELLTDRKQ